MKHLRRPAHKGRHPVHITLRARQGLPSFRQQMIHRLFAEVLRDQRRRHYKDHFRVVHFSIQASHLHLIVEADTEAALSLGAEKAFKPLRSGISGLVIAFAKRLNMMLRRKGKVWAERYHRRDLATPTETFNGIGYVLRNSEHHGVAHPGGLSIDAHSSAWLFDGWDRPHEFFDDKHRWLWPICRAGTWLLSRGYRRVGLLPLTSQA